MTDQELRFFAPGDTEPVLSSLSPQCGEVSPNGNVVDIRIWRARRDAAVRLALLALELEEIQSEQRSLQLQHDLHEINSEEWHRLVLSLADLQDYAWGLERSIERLREEVAK